MMRAICLFIALLVTHSANAEPLIYYVHNDHNGAPLMMTDENQRVVWKANYTPFGEAKIEIEEVELPVRYKGQYYDKESGLHHNYYRDYNSGRGSYQQADRIGILRDYSDPQLQVAMRMGVPLDQGGATNQLNRSYAYANSNPISYTDIFGLEVNICCRAAQIAGGLVNHCWVKTDAKSAGMGANPNIRPGEQYEGYGMPVQITDHSGDTATQCTKQNNVNEQCVNDELSIGKSLGLFLPPLNQCQSFSYGVVNKCRTGSQE